MGRCRRAGSGSLGGGEARRGADVRPGMEPGSGGGGGTPGVAGRRVGARCAALGPLRPSAPSPPHCPLGAREGKPPAGEGRSGAGPARTDGRAGLWLCARGAGPGGGAGPAAQGSAKVTAARGSHGPAKSPAAAVGEDQGPLAHASPAAFRSSAPEERVVAGEVLQAAPGFSVQRAVRG